MTLEEYLKSDEGKRELELDKQSPQPIQDFGQMMDDQEEKIRQQPGYED
jgi:cell fate (sporulation/competence/biofilm development) regulator YlbF (YheA/YmcA/DUF963 family)